MLVAESKCYVEVLERDQAIQSQREGLIEDFLGRPPGPAERAAVETALIQRLCAHAHPACLQLT